MRHFPGLENYIPTRARTAAYAHAFQSAANDALGYTANTAYDTLQKTKNGISTVKDVLGLLRATYRTIRGTGQIIDIPPAQPKALPESWIEKKVIAGGHETIITEMPVEGAIGTYILAMGHGTECSFYKPWIERMNDLGFNIVTVQLPTPEYNEYFANGDRIDDGYQKVIADTILNPDSAVYENIPDWHTMSLITHSASGRGFESTIRHSESKAEFAEDTFGDRIFHSGIMLDTAHASIRHAWIFSNVYDWYSQCKNVRNQTAGTTETDRYWIREELETAQENYAASVQTNATHAQAHALKHGGIDLVDSVENPSELGAAFKRLKRTIIMGNDETSACPLTGEDYANFVEGANFIGIDGVRHNPLMECAKAYEIIARRTIPYARQRYKELQAQAAAAASPSRALHAT